MPFWKKGAKDPQDPPPLVPKRSGLLAKFKRGNKTVEDLHPDSQRVYYRGPKWPDYSDEAKVAETTALYLRQREEFAAERRREEVEERERRRRGMVMRLEEEEEGARREEGERERERGEDEERWMVAGRELESLSLTPAQAAHYRAENARLSATLTLRETHIARLNEQIAALERRLASRSSPYGPSPTSPSGSGYASAAAAPPASAPRRHLTSPLGLEDPFFSPTPAPRSRSRSRALESETEEEEEEEERPLSPTLPPPPPPPLPLFAGRVRARARPGTPVRTPLRRR